MSKSIKTILAIFVCFFFIYHSLNFRLDASSDTLILQNDEDFQYFNYYNEIFPNKSFLKFSVPMNFASIPPLTNLRRERATKSETIRGKMEKHSTIKTAGMMKTAGA